MDRGGEGGGTESRPSLLETCSPVPLPPLSAPQRQGDFPRLLLRQLNALGKTAHALKRAQTVVAVAPTPPAASSTTLPHTNPCQHHTARTAPLSALPCRNSRPSRRQPRTACNTHWHSHSTLHPLLQTWSPHVPKPLRTSSPFTQTEISYTT